MSRSSRLANQKTSDEIALPGSGRAISSQRERSVSGGRPRPAREISCCRADWLPEAVPHPPAAGARLRWRRNLVRRSGLVRLCLAGLRRHRLNVCVATNRAGPAASDRNIRVERAPSRPAAAARFPSPASAPVASPPECWPRGSQARMGSTERRRACTGPRARSCRRIPPGSRSRSRSSPSPALTKAPRVASWTLAAISCGATPLLPPSLASSAVPRTHSLREAKPPSGSPFLA